MNEVANNKNGFGATYLRISDMYVREKQNTHPEYVCHSPVFAFNGDSGPYRSYRVSSNSTHY